MDIPKQSKKEIQAHADKFVDQGPGMVIHKPRPQPSAPLPREATLESTTNSGNTSGRSSK